MNRALTCSAAALATILAVTPTPASAQTTGDLAEKADSITLEQREAYEQRLAWGLQQAGLWAAALTPGDSCSAATYEIGTLPYGPVPDSTVGATDDYDLPPDVTNPTCTALTNCTGRGPAGSLPRGAIYTGTGTGPDRAFRIRTSANCTLGITMDPTASEDLGLIVYQANCSSSLSDCVCVSDTGVGGVSETVSLNALAGTDYFIVVDGYSPSGTPPGPSGPYTLTISGTGCALIGPAPVPGTITDGSAEFTRGASPWDTSPGADFKGVSSNLAQDHLYETGWWFRVSGDTQESFMPVPDSTVYVGDTSTFTWGDVNSRGLFSATEVSSVTDLGGPSGIVRMKLTITNLSAGSPLTIDVFHFIDMDLEGAGSDSATNVSTLGTVRIKLTDPSGNKAQYRGRGADAYLVRPFGAGDVANVLSDAAVTTFDNSGLPFGPADFTGGLQFASRTIPASGSTTVEVDFAVNQVCEPTETLLQNASVSSTVAYAACRIVAGPNYTVGASGNLTLIAEEVELAGGFSVQGGQLTITTLP